MNIPTKNTSRLKLRSFTKNDAAPLFDILSVDDMLKYFPSSKPLNLMRIEKFVQRQINHWNEHGFGWWAVEPISQDELLGWCGLQFLSETDEIEVGYLLKKAYWGQGLATEAAQVALDFGYTELEIDPIIALVHPENKASKKVINKLGMPFTEKARYFEMVCCRYELSREVYLNMQVHNSTSQN